MNTKISLHVRLVESTFLPYPLFMLTILFMFIIYIFVIIINYRQHSRYSEDILSMLSSLSNDSPLRESNYFNQQSLGKNRTGFSVISETYIFIKNIVYLLTPYFQFIWDLSEETVNQTSSNHFIITSIIFLSIHFSFDFILTFPIELCKLFIDKLHSNNNNNNDYRIEFIKKVFFLLLFLPFKILSGVVLYVVEDKINKYIPFIIIPFILMFLRICTYFNLYMMKKKELKEKDRILEKLKSICYILNFPTNRFYITTTAAATTEAEKFFEKLNKQLSFHCSCNNYINHYGNFISKKKNVIISKSYTNEIKDINEIDGLFVHEYYHYLYNTNIVLFFVYTLCDFIFMFLLYLCMNNNSFFKSFGYSDTLPAIGFSIFMTCLSNFILLVINFIKHSIIYTYEYSADKYTVSMSFGKELKNVLIHSFNQLEDDFNPDILYSLCYYENPPVVDRLRRIDKYLSNSINIYGNLSLDNSV